MLTDLSLISFNINSQHSIDIDGVVLLSLYDFSNLKHDRTILNIPDRLPVEINTYNYI